MGDRLLWRCRRGMRELDKLVEGYYRQRYGALDANAQASFRALLDEADPDLLAWLTLRDTPPACYATLIADMRDLGRSGTA